MKISIEKQIDEFSKQRFEFWFDDVSKVLWVDEYSLLKRESKRHKYKKTDYYSRLSIKNSNIHRFDVPLDDEIAKCAIEELIKDIEVKIWFR